MKKTILLLWLLLGTSFSLGATRVQCAETFAGNSTEDRLRQAKVIERINALESQMPRGQSDGANWMRENRPKTLLSRELEPHLPIHGNTSEQHHYVNQIFGFTYENLRYVLLFLAAASEEDGDPQKKRQIGRLLKESKKFILDVVEENETSIKGIFELEPRMLYWADLIQSSLEYKDETTIPTPEQLKTLEGLPSLQKARSYRNNLVKIIERLPIGARRAIAGILPYYGRLSIEARYAYLDVLLRQLVFDSDRLTSE